jgi:hypothetical protein
LLALLSGVAMLVAAFSTVRLIQAQFYADLARMGATKPPSSKPSVFVNGM